MKIQKRRRMCPLCIRCLQVHVTVSQNSWLKMVQASNSPFTDVPHSTSPKQQEHLKVWLYMCLYIQILCAGVNIGPLGQLLCKKFALSSTNGLFLLLFMVGHFKSLSGRDTIIIFKPVSDVRLNVNRMSQTLVFLLMFFFFRGGPTFNSVLVLHHRHQDQAVILVHAQWLSLEPFVLIFSRTYTGKPS